ncbi:MAG: hypothetical protein CMA96_02735 [Euryarchaeota archaeon]|nr:hypothetical protein [Euryarchaeota archaeon]
MIYDAFTFNFLRWTLATLTRVKGHDSYVAIQKSRNQAFRLRGPTPSDTQFQAYLNAIGKTGRSSSAPTATTTISGDASARPM